MPARRPSMRLAKRIPSINEQGYFAGEKDCKTFLD
jgi:hypothetical protein